MDGYAAQSGIVLSDNYAVTFFVRSPGYLRGPPAAANVAAIMRWMHEGVADPIIHVEFDHLGHYVAQGRYL